MCLIGNAPHGDRSGRMMEPEERDTWAMRASHLRVHRVRERAIVLVGEVSEVRIGSADLLARAYRHCHFTGMVRAGANPRNDRFAGGESA